MKNTTSNRNNKARFFLAVVLVTTILLGIFWSIQSPQTVGKVVAADAASPLSNQTIQPPDSPRKDGVELATPAPPDSLTVTLTSSYITATSNMSNPWATLPDLNSLEDVPPVPSSIPTTALATYENDAGIQAWTCRDYGGCWWDGSNSYKSSCYVNLSKRAVGIELFFPIYGWLIPLAQGQAWAYHRFWSWNPTAGKWETTTWGAPTTQTVYSNMGSGHFLFRNTYFNPYNSSGSIGGADPLMYPLPITGLTGPSWFMIQRYVYLSQLNEPPVGMSSWVTFSNGGNMCGANFPSAAQTGTEEEELFAIALAPTPPSGAYPTFSFLPLIVRPSGSGIVPTPTPIATPYLPPPPTPSSAPITGNMQNANFDTGPHVGWTEYSSQGYPVVMPGPKGFNARSGQYLAWLGGAHNDISTISQALTVPVSHPYLSLYLMASSQEDLCHYDRAAIYVNEYHVASIGLCKSQNFHSWLKNQIDLTDFAGQTITLKIKVETDDSLLSSLFVDDLSFESGVLIPTPVPSPTPIPSDGTIRNPGFELGNNGDWATSTTSGAGNIFLHTGAHSGNWLAWLGGMHNEIGYIEQTVYIPPGRPYLTYWGWISSAETSCGGDYVQFFTGSTALYGYNLCVPYNSTSWGQGWVNFSAYAGTTQTIRIQVQTNSALLSSLYLDDFAFAASPPTGLASESGAHTFNSNMTPNAAAETPSVNQSAALEPEVKEPLR
jgi:hypothetical protein